MRDLPDSHIGEYLKARSRAFASEVIQLCASLKIGDLAQVIRPQLLRAATGTACNYRAVCRSRSDKEFVSRLAVAIEEVDEAEFWLDMVGTHVTSMDDRTSALQDEAGQLRAIFVSSRSTVLERLRREEEEQNAESRSGSDDATPGTEDREPREPRDPRNPSRNSEF